MKKLLILAVIAIVSLSLTGCGKKEQATQKEKPQGGFEVLPDNSLMGWLKRGKSVECRLKTPEGEIVMMVKDKTVRMEGIPFMSMDSMGEVPNPENGVSLTNEEWMYMWDKKSKKGTKMNLKKMKELSPDGIAQEQQTWEDQVLGWEDIGINYDCKEKKLDKDLFEQPNGVEFSDLTEFMEGMTNMGKQIQEQTQDGGEMDMEDMEKQMKELQEKYNIEQ